MPPEAQTAGELKKSVLKIGKVVRISRSNYVCIPAEICSALDICGGDKVAWSIDGEMISIFKLPLTFEWPKFINPLRKRPASPKLQRGESAARPKER